MTRHTVAIIVPICRSMLEGHEAIAYRRIRDLYGHLPIVLVAPAGVEVTGFLAEDPALRVERFAFQTVRDYSQLLLQREFYERFTHYEFILIHQLDAYLLKDELHAWCAQDYDYLGAPFFRDFEPLQPAGRLWRVGNGGFSLRKVAAALAVLDSTRRWRTPAQYWAERPRSARLRGLARRALASGAKVTPFHNDVRWAALHNFHEDVFWSVEAPHFWPEFRLPGVEAGLRFAFDYAPAHCYELNGRELPFGCHAWPRYDLAFWRRFIPEA